MVCRHGDETYRAASQRHNNGGPFMTKKHNLTAIIFELDELKNDKVQHAKLKLLRQVLC
jgi:hypothetical protein